MVGLLRPIDRAAGLRRARVRHRERIDERRFDALVASPHDFGATAASSTTPNALTLPGNARLAISHSAALLQGGVTADLSSGLDFTHPDLSADVVHRGRWAERGRSVTVDRGLVGDAPAGTLTLYIVDGFGRHRAIGTATFT